MEIQTEIEHIKKSIYGDQQSYSVLVRKYSNAIYSVAYSILNDFHAAQDIAQDAFVKAWFNIDQLKDPSKFGAWVISIARNLCNDRLRKHKILEMPLNEAFDIPDEVTLEEIINRKSDSETIWRAVSVLDKKYRFITLMYFIGGFNAREISKLLEIPVPTVESRLRRSKALLKKELIELVENAANEKKLGEAFIGKVKARIKNVSVVFLVASLEESINFYEEIGFVSEDIGGHIHMNYGGATFILHEVKQNIDVRPFSAAVGGLYFDAFCYTDPEGLRHLVEVFQFKGVEIVNGPHWTERWSEVTIRDNNGYQIAFGANNE
ncbi:sigma-70 family RNA polymerase sigma factor [Paenibacillus psychroresistens]|uniref:sigma-70 family RNA polymerase sigma factor n=1 Tax=Paenibacillus psychroresistens TaxID=1778678 RepID=UPI00139114CE|nr:sigma-70 family RNA polymerase sigma factor [Paenibacillus psychroresistens]